MLATSVDGGCSREGGDGGKNANSPWKMSSWHWLDNIDGYQKQKYVKTQVAGGDDTR